MEFKNKDIEKQYLERVENIKRMLDAPVDDNKYLWDETVRKYAVKIEQIKRILADDTLSEYRQDLPDKLESFLMQCSNPEFQIALVGTIKAGKSTLINALLDYELASTRVTPETAALTKFRHADEDSVEISFYNSEEWERLWKSVQKAANSVFMDDYKRLDAESAKGEWIGHEPMEMKLDGAAALKEEIEKWTSSRSAVHYFVKEVTVNLKDFDLQEGVVLVDTPGLDDVVEFRSDITRNYIDRANAVLICNKCSAITKGELETLCRVFDNAPGNAEKIYVIATQMDNLNDPEGDWKKQSEEWMKYLKGKGCYGNEALVKNNLLPVSAYLYTLLNDYNNNRLSKEIDRDRYKTFKSILFKLDIEDNDELNDQFQSLVDFTNIKTLRRKLNDEVVAKRKGILMNDLKTRYDNCRKAIGEVMGKVREEQENLIASGQKSIDEIRAQRDEYEAKLKEAQEDKRELAEYVEHLRENTRDRIESLMQAIKGTRR